MRFLLLTALAAVSQAAFRSTVDLGACSGWPTIGTGCSANTTCTGLTCKETIGSSGYVLEADFYHCSKPFAMGVTVTSGSVSKQFRVVQSSFFSSGVTVPTSIGAASIYIISSIQNTSSTQFNLALGTKLCTKGTSGLKCLSTGNFAAFNGSFTFPSCPAPPPGPKPPAPKPPAPHPPPRPAPVPPVGPVGPKPAPPSGSPPSSNTPSTSNNPSTSNPPPSSNPSSQPPPSSGNPPPSTNNPPPSTNNPPPTSNPPPSTNNPPPSTNNPPPSTGGNPPPSSGGGTPTSGGSSGGGSSGGSYVRRLGALAKSRAARKL